MSNMIDWKAYEELVKLFSLNCGIVFLTFLGDAQSGGLLCSLFVFDWKAQVDCKLKFSL